MRFRFTQEQQRFREEVSAFLQQEMSPEYQTVYGTFSEDKYWFGRALACKLAGKGWLTIGWPKKYGGGGKTFLEQSIPDEQIGHQRVQRVGIIGLNFAGPAIIKFGTEDQKTGICHPSLEAMSSIVRDSRNPTLVPTLRPSKCGPSETAMVTY